MQTSEILGGKMEEISDKENIFFDHSNYKEIDYMAVRILSLTHLFTIDIHPRNKKVLY